MLKLTKNLMIFESNIEKNVAYQFVEINKYVENFKIIDFHNLYATSLFQKNILVRPIFHLLTLLSILLVACYLRPRKLVVGAPVLGFRLAATVLRSVGVKIYYLMPYANITEDAFSSYGRVEGIICDESNSNMARRLYNQEPIIWRKNTSFSKLDFLVQIPDDQFSLIELKDIVNQHNASIELCLDAFRSHNETKIFSREYKVIYQTLITFFEENGIDFTVRHHPREPSSLVKVSNVNIESDVKWCPKKKISMAISSSRIQELQSDDKSAYYIKPHPSKFVSQTASLSFSKKL